MSTKLLKLCGLAGVIASIFILLSVVIVNANPGSENLLDSEPTPHPTNVPERTEPRIQFSSTLQEAPTDRGIDPDTLIVSLFDKSDLQDPVRTLRWVEPLDFYFDCFGEDYPYEGCELVEDLTEGGNWSVKWEGTLVVPTDGDYTFSLPGHDDGVRVIIDGNEIVDSGWRYPSPNIHPSPQTVNLSEGNHQITVDYEQRFPFIAELEVRWDGPGFNDEALPVMKQVGLSIDSIEISQAIQIYQSLSDLKADLADNGEPPIPVVAFKPTVLRIYLAELDAQTRAQIGFDIEPGWLRTRDVSIAPNCTPKEQREREGGCSSIDFFFGAQKGDWTGTIILQDNEGNELESIELEFSSRDQEPIKHVPVSICYIDLEGNAGCEDGREILKYFGYLRSLAPTHGVYGVGETRNLTVLEPFGPTALLFDWWFFMVEELNALWLWDSIRAGEFLTDRFYYGAVPEDAPGEWGGMAGLRGGGSRIYQNRADKELVNSRILAHETGHLLEREHPGVVNPGPPICNEPSILFRDNNWPYEDLYIQEMGIDIPNNELKFPDVEFDIMSYCPLRLRWVSPYTYGSEMYSGMMEYLAKPEISQKATSPATPLWQISGMVNLEESTAYIAPIFELVGQASPGNLAGVYYLDVLDNQGELLYSHRFLTYPAQTQDDATTPGPDVVVFSEAIPSFDDAAQIILRSNELGDLGQVDLGGAVPEVMITTSLIGLELSGKKMISWEVFDADTDEHTFRVFYSADGGKSQHVIGWGNKQLELLVDFDELPVCDQDCQIQVWASDGANTGTALASGFTLPAKPPLAEITFPAEGQNFGLGEVVHLQGFGWDPDDGYLDAGSMTWSSDVDGVLGSGSDLPFTDLSEGIHALKLEVTDNDGNLNDDVIAIHVDGSPPELDLFVIRDEIPSSCVNATIDASEEIGGTGLDLVAYSLDGGELWTEIPITEIPFSFTVPGSGRVHLVVRAVDAAGNQEIVDLPFTIQTPCSAANRPPTADAGASYASTEGSEVVLDGSGSSDPDNNIATFEWDLDDDGSFDDANGSMVRTVFGDNGTYLVALKVTDEQGEYSTDRTHIIVENVQPDLELDTATAIALPGGEAFLGRIGAPQTHQAQAIDPGSDDLIFTWDLMEPTPYYNNGVGSDPYPSPGGDYPFSANDSAEFNFTNPGVYVIPVRVHDDDGAEDSLVMNKLITGDAVCTRSQGFWKHQFRDNGNQHFDALTLAAYLEIIEYASRVFSEDLDIQSIEDAYLLMNPSGSDMEAKLQGQLLAAWLNFAHGSVDLNELIDTDGDGLGDMLLFELMEFVENTLLQENPSHIELVQAKDFIELVNLLDEGKKGCK